MADQLTPDARSALMSRIKSKDTKPERIVRSLIHRMGYRFRLHRKDLPGSPDIVLPRHKKVIFVHGCFWHRHQGCTKASIPKTRPEFWKDKFHRNVARDKRNQLRLEEDGWEVMVVWECEVAETEKLVDRLTQFLA